MSHFVETLSKISYNAKGPVGIMGSDFNSEDALFSDKLAAERIDRNTSGGRRFYLLQPGKYIILLEQDLPREDNARFFLRDEKGNEYIDEVTVEGKALAIELKFESDVCGTYRAKPLLKTKIKLVE